MTCPDHNLSLPCVKCLERMSIVPDHVDLRVGELVHWIELGVLTVPWETLMARFDQLVGRPVYTHEYAHPWRLVDECRRRG